MTPKKPEAEWLTRKKRIDPRLDALGWTLPKGTGPHYPPFRSEEFETDAGPADYTLHLDGSVVGIIEAKKLTVGPQNVLTQAERYARGLTSSPYDFDGLRAPFLYSTNGEVIWFHDVRHPLNRSRRVASFHTPEALKELLARNETAAFAKLTGLPNNHPWLRPYQKAANEGIEKAILERRRRLLVAMATGCGKTFTTVNQVYRLMKTGVAQRVLFLVDRRALAAQAVRAFSAFEAEPGTKFDKVYEVYSNRFQKEDFGEDEKFDPKVLPSEYLTNPQAKHAFVYVCTIQRMAMNVLGRNAIFGVGEEPIDEDADQIDIPIHAFDVIIADECHRGYTAAEQSVWRSTLDHFDAIKIGLTATPAAHTSAYFTHLAYKYDYATAVRDGFLVDYDQVHIKSQVRMDGLFLKEGENVEVVDPETGLSKMDQLEDERAFATTEIEAKVTAPDSNLKIVHEVKKYADDHEQRFGRFPKTLFFAVNDLPHTSHADQLVQLCRDVWNRGDAFVEKITGRVDRPLQRIREFRNRPNPGIAVTVDLLSTGVDIPDLEFIVFLRPVKSRILFEQMMGRGTRKGEKHRDKAYFTVFDCFDGTLLRYFREATGITAEAPDKQSRTVKEIIEAIWDNRDRDYNIRCLVKRLHRVDKQMSAEGRELFAAFVPDGDLARYARGLPGKLREDFVKAMETLRNSSFQDLLVNYPRPERSFVKAYEVQDEVSSMLLVRDGLGNEYKPQDYISAFAQFVKSNPAQIEAIRILLDRPQEWSADALAELRQKLSSTEHHFREEVLQRAHQLAYSKALVDIISMVKHAANEQNPLLTASERVERAFEQVTAGRTFTADQRAWLDRIKEHLRANLSIDREDFEFVPIFTREGGWPVVHKVFGDDIDELIHRLNEAIAA
ncbi:MAG: DEAD/DEAH box helicase family protein [Polyangiaceae bacterium]|nr:DEAD/DEAH box helicase family protein [Polyangiaceae bacterium]